MSQRRPPIIGTWLLQRLADRYQRDALIGDLNEEYRCGRTLGWYWRQVGLAILFRCRRSAERRLPAAKVATAWWGSLFLVALALKSAALAVMTFDPSFYWWIAKRRASSAETKSSL